MLNLVSQYHYNQVTIGIYYLKVNFIIAGYLSSRCDETQPSHFRLLNKFDTLFVILYIVRLF